MNILHSHILIELNCIHALDLQIKKVSIPFILYMKPIRQGFLWNYYWSWLWETTNMRK